MYREYCAPSWFHLEDSVEMHSQQNIKYTVLLCGLSIEVC